MHACSAQLGSVSLAKQLYFFISFLHVLHSAQLGQSL